MKSVAQKNWQKSIFNDNFFSLKQCDEKSKTSQISAIYPEMKSEAQKNWQNPFLKIIFFFLTLRLRNRFWKREEFVLIFWRLQTFRIEFPVTC